MRRRRNKKRGDERAYPAVTFLPFPRQIAGLSIAAFVLTLGVWLAFYIATPTVPLNAVETAFVFGAALLLAWAVKRMWRWVRLK